MKEKCGHLFPFILHMEKYFKNQEAILADRDMMRIMQATDDLMHLFDAFKMLVVVVVRKLVMVRGTRVVVVVMVKLVLRKMPVMVVVVGMLMVVAPRRELRTIIPTSPKLPNPLIPMESGWFIITENLLYLLQPPFFFFCESPSESYTIGTIHHLSRLQIHSRRNCETTEEAVVPRGHGAVWDLRS